jgi:hypothetical protein
MTFDEHLARRARGLLVLAVASLAACRAKPVVAPARSAGSPPVPAAHACPAPKLRGVKWVLASDSAGFTIALPPGFQEQGSGGAFRHWESPEGYRPYMSFGIIRGNLGLSGYRRAYQPELMPDYSECSDTVNGYSVSIQAWRTPNGVFRNYRRYDRYDVFAIWEVRPGEYAYLTGGTDDQPTQVVMLGAVRAWKVQKR